MLKNSILSLKPSFGLSIEIWSGFSRLVCFNWVVNEVFTSFMIEENLWTHDKLDVLMRGNNIYREVITPKHTVYKKII